MVFSGVGGGERVQVVVMDIVNVDPLNTGRRIEEADAHVMARFGGC